MITTPNCFIICRNKHVKAIKSNLINKEELSQIVRQFKDIIADRIFRQMKDHFSLSPARYIKPTVLPFVEITSSNLTKVYFQGLP